MTHTPKIYPASLPGTATMLGLLIGALAFGGPTDPSCEHPAFADRGYCNASLPIDARVDDLLGRLTMEEKTAVRHCLCLVLHRAYDSALACVSATTVAKTVPFLAGFQHVLESGGSVPRLGVPTLGSTECLRGYLSMFPQVCSRAGWFTCIRSHSPHKSLSHPARAVRRRSR